MVGLTSILKEAWNAATNTQDKRERIQALSLAKECYSMKLDLLTNTTVVNDAIRFVNEKSHSNLKDINESNQDEDENETDKEATNKVF
jgi:hypothetical protein